MALLNYVYPIAAGGVTPPTAAQMFGKSAVNVEVTAELYDESIVITHNMALSAAQLANDWPDVAPEYPTAAAASSHPRVTARAANTVTIAGLSPGVTIFKITRPSSLTK